MLFLFLYRSYDIKKAKKNDEHQFFKIIQENYIQISGSSFICSINQKFPQDKKRGTACCKFFSVALFFILYKN